MAKDGSARIEHNEAISSSRLFPTNITYGDLQERYTKSIYGVHHSEQPLRFSARYGYDREAMLADLGDDVHPVRHMAYTEKAIVRPFLNEQNVRGDERFDRIGIVAVRSAATLHDIGECEHDELHERTGYKIGDIPWDLKTDEDGRRETVIRKYLYSILYTDVPYNILNAADDIIDHKKGSIEREAFNVVERLGYYVTSLRAGGIALRLQERRNDSDELRYIQLSHLALVVSDNHRQSLRDQDVRFPYVRVVLDANERLDERIHASLSISTM